MTPFLSNRLIAADAYEALIENAIVQASDLYDLDGETLFRNRGGRVETGTGDAFGQEAWS